jgi:hypothetical protein
MKPCNEGGVKGFGYLSEQTVEQLLKEDDLNECTRSQNSTG